MADKEKTGVEMAVEAAEASEERRLKLLAEGRYEVYAPTEVRPMTFDTFLTLKEKEVLKSNPSVTEIYIPVQPECKYRNTVVSSRGGEIYVLYNDRLFKEQCIRVGQHVYIGWEGLT